MKNFEIRKYNPKDCEQIINLFCDTIKNINSKDYNKEQIDAWISGSKDINKWNQSFLEHYTIVAEKNNKIIGFGDIDTTGYLDRLYVNKDYLNQGIASAICDRLENKVNSNKITTHASITAKPFFEHREYKVIKECHVLRKGIYLMNYQMEKIREI